MAALTTLNQVFYPIHLDETGTPALDGFVFTGTGGSGTMSEHIYNCSDWTTSSESRPRATSA